ncbi:MAG: hypothetical protein ACI9FO_000305 [Methylophagaceae bacterium]
MSKNFNVTKYSESFKQFRNQVRKYPAESMVHACISHINQPSESTLEELHLLPWYFVLLIKWVLTDPLCKKSGRKNLTQNEFMKISQLLDELMGLTRLPSDFDNHILFMRAIAAQQFPYQQKLSSGFIARQSLLFSPLAHNHSINTDFNNHTGISIQTYLDLSFMTFVLLEQTNTNSIAITNYRQIHIGYSTSTVNKYIELISKSFNDMKSWASQDENKGFRSPSELYEPSLLLNYPFIRTSDSLICIHPQLFYRSIENFVFDTLARLNKQRLMSKFGEIFENYVNDGLTRADLYFIREHEIKKRYGNSGLQVDFLVETETSNVFIESKAAELPRQAIAAHDKKIIQDKTQYSAIKAIAQAHAILNKMPENEAQKQNYLLIVTYKESFIGNGKKFHDYMATEAINEILEKNDYSRLIPMENIYFLNISDFDFFCEMIKNKTIDLVEVIERAKQSDLTPETSKFIFSQHLMNWWNNDKPEHLSAEFERIQTDLMNNLNLKQ